MNVTDVKCEDNRAAFAIPVAPYSVAVADRGYCDFALPDKRDSKIAKYKWGLADLVVSLSLNTFTKKRSSWRNG